MAFDSKYTGQEIENILNNIGEPINTTPIPAPVVNGNTTDEILADMIRLKKYNILLINDTPDTYNSDPGIIDGYQYIGASGFAKFITETNERYEIVITRVVFDKDKKEKSYLTYTYIYIPKTIGEKITYESSHKKRLYSEEEAVSIETVYINRDDSIYPGKFNVIPYEIDHASFKINHESISEYYLTFTAGEDNIPFSIDKVKWATPINIKSQYKYQVRILDDIGNIYGVSAIEGDYSGTIGIDQSNISSIAINKYITTSVYGDFVNAIKLKSFRCVGKYVDNKMYICRLKRFDSTLYHDGTAYDVADGDVFLKPGFFSYNANLSDNIASVTFSTKEGNFVNGWNNVFQNELIGVYKAYNQNGVLRSISNVMPTTSLSLAQFKELARARGAGYHLVTYAHHVNMILLYLMYYQDLDSQYVIGRGPWDAPMKTGGTNSMGVMDSSYFDDSRYSEQINLFGLEDWWGNVSEWVDNVGMDTDNVLKVFNPLSNGVIHTFDGYPTTSGWISRLKMTLSSFEAYPDMVSEDTYEGGKYKDWFKTDSSVQKGMIRSGYGDSEENGIFYMGLIDPATVSSEIGSRLAYTGEIVEVENVQEFKAL